MVGNGGVCDGFEGCRMRLSGVARHGVRLGFKLMLATTTTTTPISDEVGENPAIPKTKGERNSKVVGMGEPPK